MPYGNTLIIAANGAGVMDGSDPEGLTGGPPPTRSTANYMVFGHSLFTYTGGDAAPATSLTQSGNWLGRLATASDTQSGGNHLFGQYSNHNAQPWPNPNTNGGFTDNTFDPWPSGNFPDQSFELFLLMPSNFLESDMGGPPYSQPVANSVSEFNTLYDNIIASYPSAEITLYCHEPDAGQWPGGVNKSSQERDDYNAAVSGDYLDWFIEKQDAIVASGRDILMAPVGPIIADLWQNEAYMSGVAFNEMYGDDAPHGSENIYLLKAMIMYRMWFRQNPNVGALSLTGATQLIPEVTNNLIAIRDYIETRLNYYNANGVRVYPA